MNRMLRLLIINVVLFSTPALSQIDLDVEQTVLENGLTVLTCEIDAFPTVSHQMFVSAGSRDELRAGATGVAHVLEHLMFRGTEKNPDYMQAVSHMGPQVNAYTGQDYTCYYVNAKSEFLPEIIEIEADRIRNFNFSPETFGREMGPVREERRRFIADDPDGYMSEQIYRLAYTRHTYEHPVIGWENDVERNLSYRDANDFKDVFYSPNFVTIIIVGDFETEEALNLIHQYYSDWPSSLPPIGRVREEPRQKRERTMNLTWKSPEISPRVNIAYHGPDLNFHDKDLLALQVLARMMFGEGGRLNTLLKDDLGLVDRINAEYEGMKDPGLFVIDLTLRDPKNRDSTLRIIYDGFDKIRKGQVSADELTRTVNELKAEYVFRLDRPARIAGTLGYYQLSGGDYKLMFTYYEMLSTISGSDLAHVAEKYLIASNRSVVTLMPEKME